MVPFLLCSRTLNQDLPNTAQRRAVIGPKMAKSSLWKRVDADRRLVDKGANQSNE